MMLSHIDDDHINGILELTGELVTAADAGEPLPLKIRQLWHNSFDDIIGDTPKELLASVTAAYGAEQPASAASSIPKASPRPPRRFWPVLDREFIFATTPGD
jgi:hypothetical protein